MMKQSKAGITRAGDTATSKMKTYLGDSVYADFDGYHVVLTTENGSPVDPSNRIACEPEVLTALDQFIKELRDSKLPPTPASFPSDSVMGSKINTAAEYAKINVERVAKGGERVARILAQLSDSCDLNPYGGTFWFTVSNREDVQVLMQIAPRWAKSTHDAGIDYDAEVDGVSYKIRTVDAALPPTCKLVEREVEIPAVPAQIVKRLVVECAKPEAETAEPATI